MWAEQVILVCSERAMQEDFQHVFNQLLASSGKSLSRVATISGIDRSYILRLSTGEKTNPSSTTIVRLFIALCFDLDMIERDPSAVFGLHKLLLAAASAPAALLAG